MNDLELGSEGVKLVGDVWRRRYNDLDAKYMQLAKDFAELEIKEKVMADIIENQQRLLGFRTQKETEA
jgi:hypothetical protein